MPEQLQHFPYSGFQRDAKETARLAQHSRLWLYLVMSTIVLAPLTAFWFTLSLARAEFGQQFREASLELASSLATQIDGNEQRAILAGDREDPAYNSLLLQLQQFLRTQPDVLNLRVLVLNGDVITTVFNTAETDPSQSLTASNSLEDLLFVSAIRQQQNWYRRAEDSPAGNNSACVPFTGSSSVYPAMFCLETSSARLEARSSAFTLKTGSLAFIVLLVSLGLVYSLLQHQAQYRLSLELIQKQRDLFINSALTDPLTGALNRRALHLVYASAQSQLQRNRLPFAVISFNLDRFKIINEKHGQDHGDQLLGSLVKNMQRVLRSSDHLARVGGDEFCIICNVPDRDSAWRLAEKLRLLAAETSVGDAPPKEAACSVSLGIYIPDKGESMQGALQTAAAALAAAKAAGRNRTVIHKHASPDS